MKKTQTIKGSLLILFILLGGIVQANSDDKKTEYEKIIHEKYAIDSNALLKLYTNFTNVEIIPWNKNEIDISVEIQVSAKSEKEAEKWFDKIDIDIEGSSSQVSLRSTLRKGNSNSHNDEDWFVTAIIHAPRSIGLDAEVEFGNLHLEEINGECDIDIEFGNLGADKMTHPHNNFDIEYGNMEIGELAAKDISVQFGILNVDLFLSSTCIISKFSTVEIDMVDENCKDLRADVEFGGFEITLPSRGNFAIDASSSFGDIDLDHEIDIRNKDKGMFDISYDGIIGDGSGKIVIKSSYGSVDVNVK